MGSTWGKELKISVFGESHGTGVGVVIDGFPAGFRPDMEFVTGEMARRAPGQNQLTTARKETDAPVILSGMLDGVTTGAPVCAMIYNQDTRSKDYEYLKTLPRPGHSDFTGSKRYKGFNDIRGSGHFSGRLTAPLVFAGALCKGYLSTKYDIRIGSHIYKIGEAEDDSFDFALVDRKLLEDLTGKTIPVLNEKIEEKIMAEVAAAKNDRDSIGGIIECAMVGIRAGIGSPIFDNVESRLASILFSVPAVKGLEFGLGFGFVGKRGSEVNDCFEKSGETIRTKTNHSGGISGGITTGMPIVFRIGFKPTPSIGKEQQTLNLQTGEQDILQIRGRHDPCIVLRAPVVVEAASAIALLDLLLEAYGYDA